MTIEGGRRFPAEEHEQFLYERGERLEQSGLQAIAREYAEQLALPDEFTAILESPEQHLFGESIDSLIVAQYHAAFRLYILNDLLSQDNTPEEAVDLQEEKDKTIRTFFEFINSKDGFLEGYFYDEATAERFLEGLVTIESSDEIDESDMVVTSLTIRTMGYVPETYEMLTTAEIEVTDIDSRGNGPSFHFVDRFTELHWSRLEDGRYGLYERTHTDGEGGARLFESVKVVDDSAREYDAQLNAKVLDRTKFPLLAVVSKMSSDGEVVPVRAFMESLKDASGVWNRTIQWDIESDENGSRLSPELATYFTQTVDEAGRLVSGERYQLQVSEGTFLSGAPRVVRTHQVVGEGTTQQVYTDLELMHQSPLTEPEVAAEIALHIPVDVVDGVGYYDIEFAQITMPASDGENVLTSVTNYESPPLTDEQYELLANASLYEIEALSFSEGPDVFCGYTVMSPTLGRVTIRTDKNGRYESHTVLRDVRSRFDFDSF